MFSVTFVLINQYLGDIYILAYGQTVYFVSLSSPAGRQQRCQNFRVEGPLGIMWSTTLLAVGMTSASFQLSGKLAFLGDFQWHKAEGLRRQPTVHLGNFLTKFFPSNCLVVSMQQCKFPLPRRTKLNLNFI